MVRLKATFIVFLLVCFTSTFAIPSGYAQGLVLVPPGVMVEASPAFVPLIMKGLTVHPDNPLLFDFIMDTGNTGLKVDGNQDVIKEQSHKLVKYFLASLTIPEQDQWVNLSPYEKDRMLPEELGKTELGRDMLAQDYLLKQVTASFLHPDKDLGREFWSRVYAKAEQELGTSEIPLDIFNKVWIVADTADVVVKNNTAVIVGAHLKVMLESDYLAAHQQAADPARAGEASQELIKSVVRDIVLPELEKDVNTGKNFADLRQIFHSMILATWYKKNLKQALLTQAYANKSKTAGIQGAWVTLKGADLDPQAIWNKYEEAYKKGVFNFIKDEVNVASGESVAHKYFSGGLTDMAQAHVVNKASLNDAAAVGSLVRTTVEMRSDADASVPMDTHVDFAEESQKPEGSVAQDLRPIILVAEDDQALARLFKVTIPSIVGAGFRVIVLHSAQEVMRELKRHGGIDASRVVAIFTDTEMSDRDEGKMHGWDLVHNLLKQGFDDLPVILMSNGLGHKDYLEHGIEARDINVEDIHALPKGVRPFFNKISLFSKKDFFLKAFKTFARDVAPVPAPASASDQAQVGGIDLDAGKMSLTQTGDKVVWALDPVMVAQFKSGDFTGVTPVIINITPITSLAVL